MIIVSSLFFKGWGYLCTEIDNLTHRRQVYKVIPFSAYTLLRNRQSSLDWTLTIFVYYLTKALLV